MSAITLLSTSFDEPHTPMVDVSLQCSTRTKRALHLLIQVIATGVVAFLCAYGFFYMQTPVAALAPALTSTGNVAQP